MTCVSKVGIGADTPRLWDRRADETPKSYAAFLAYVALGGRRRPDTAGPLAVATPTTRRLADASISRNTRRAYAGALRRLDACAGPPRLTTPRWPSTSARSSRRAARAFPDIGPANVKGLEINPYAAELARVSVWIGETTWM